MEVKVGLIGTGVIAQRHVGALEKIEAAVITACTDVDEERAAEMAARLPGAGAYGDAARMLDEQELDTVFICVPPHAHGEIEMALIQRGVPFFVEKPISNDRQTPAGILEAVKSKNLMTSVGYMNRYRATVERARQHVAEDPPVLARGAWIGGMPGVPWWRRKAQSGGQIMEQTTHIFDLARYLFGEVETVFCAGRTGLLSDVEDYDIEDASICVMKFQSGMLCELSSSCAVSVGGGVSLEVFCRSSRLKLSGWDLGLEIGKAAEKCQFSSTEEIFEVEDRAWIEAVETGDSSAIKSPYEDACKSQMLACAANESLALGRPARP